MISNMKHTGITNDSRKVKPGFIYVAIKGEKFNGEDFIPQAIEAGATKVITANNYANPPDNIEILQVDNPRATYAHEAAKFYIGQPECTVAVTGTNGKTSTASMYRQISELLGKKAATIGTLGVETSIDLELEASEILTSPEPGVLHKTLQTMADKGVTHLAVEASSHGLDQHRVDGMQIRASAFTNLTPEHLDYHANMREYLAAKARLFAELTSETVVLNADVGEYDELAAIARNKGLRVMSYGSNGVDIRLLGRQGDTLSLEVLGQKYDLEFHLVGDFQNYNVMAAIGLALAIGFEMSEIASITGKLVAAPGRLEYVGNFAGGKIYVDFSHTPDALEKALENLRSICGSAGKLHVVFGCGGERDVKKRPVMGEIAAKLADRVYVTDDNPRGEDPAAIRAEVMVGCPEAANIGDRAEAIKAAMAALAENDVLLITGKGHETYQIIGNEKQYFSDHEVVQRVIMEREGA